LRKNENTQTFLQEECEELQKRSKVLQQACQVKSDILLGLLETSEDAVEHSKALIEKLSQQKLVSQD
jgi:hypothetical protein